MDFIFSLAHFCEVHGPTSVLCTQALPQPCQSCEHSISSSFSSDSSPPKNSWVSSSFLPRTHDPFANTYDDAALASSFDSKPSSPHLGEESFNPYFPQFAPKESTVTAFGGGIDINSDACANCSFEVPKELSEQLPEGAPGSLQKDGKRRNGNPVLRTKGSVLAYDTSGYTENKSEELGRNIDLAWNIPLAIPSLGIRRPPSMGTTSSIASSLSNPLKTHTHNLVYLTTRQPNSPTAFSLLRRSCIRTLSCENLPRGSPSGPILFGDPVGGYTIAFIFRLPDKSARGRRRTYALIALGGRDCWRASAAMIEITRVFTSIANWIVGLAEKGHQPEAKVQAESGGGDADKAAKNIGITPVSSFLLAKKIDPDGYARFSTNEPRGAKGLAEIVGREGIFVELHVQFVRLLAQLGRQFGG